MRVDRTTAEIIEEGLGEQARATRATRATGRGRRPERPGDPGLRGRPARPHDAGRHAEAARSHRRRGGRPQTPIRATSCSRRLGRTVTRPGRIKGLLPTGTPGLPARPVRSAASPTTWAMSRCPTARRFAVAIFTSTSMTPPPQRERAVAEEETAPPASSTTSSRSSRTDTHIWQMPSFGHGRSPHSLLPVVQSAVGRFRWLMRTRVPRRRWSLSCRIARARCSG